MTRILEIGTHFGGSALAMCRGMPPAAAGFGHYVLKLIHLVGEQAVGKWEKQTQGTPKITMYKSLFDREAKPPKYNVLDAMDFLAEKVGPREADSFIEVARKELAQSVQRQDQ